MAKKRANGEGTIRKRKDGRWEAMYTVHKKRKSIYGKTQSEVRKRLNKIICDADKGTYIESTSVSVGEWMWIWLNEYKRNNVKKKTYESYSELIRLHIEPFFSDIRLKKLGVADVQSFINTKTEEGLSARTVRYMNTILHGALKQAVRNGMISQNVAEGTVLPEREQKEPKLLSPREQERFVECIKKDGNGFALLFCLATGLRRGELLALKWENYDFENGCVTIKESLCRLRGDDGRTHLTFTSPKTPSSKRTIPILPEMAQLLEEHKRCQDKQRRAAGADWRENDLVFCTKLGTPIDPANLYRALGGICERAGIGKISVHALRHAFATRALENGIPLKVVSDMLGHSSIAITADVYSHVSLKTMEREIKKLSCMF